LQPGLKTCQSRISACRIIRNVEMALNFEGEHHAQRVCVSIGPRHKFRASMNRGAKSNWKAGICTEHFAGNNLLWFGTRDLFIQYWELV
jgi:hypothetical protein